MGKPTELMQLLKTGNSDAARKLIAKMKKSGKKKALAKELNIPDETGAGQTVIHYCAAQNFVEFLHDLADLGATIDLPDNRGLTPLHLAAGAGRSSSVSALLGRGANANIAAPNGDTPIHLACQHGHAQTVEALLAEHANCTMLNVSGHTPLDLACGNGHAAAVAAILRSGQFPQSFLQRSDMPHSALLLAAKSGHNEVVSLLVKHGFDVNRKLPGANGNCLHEAALYGKVETVKFLLQCGADITSVNNQGLSALDIVNMYTDPRSAGQMKQVLQDALAQHAHVKIAQQHQQQQQQQHQSAQHFHQGHPSHSGHPGQSYQRQPSREGQYHQQPPQRQQSHQHQGAGFSYMMPGMGKPPSPRMHAQRQQQPSPQQQQQQRSSGGGGVGGGAYPQGHPGVGGAGYHHPQQQPSPQQSYQHHQPQPPPPSSQPQQQYPQQQQHQQQQRHDQLRQLQMQQQQQQHQQAAAASYQQQRQNSYPQPPQQQAHHPPQHQPQPAGAGGGYQHQQSYPGVTPQQQQQQQQQPGGYHQQQHQGGYQATPDASRRSGGAVMSGGPADLAAMIAAKAASRKPMTTSPTRKDFPSGGVVEQDTRENRLMRSSTMSSDSGSASDARQAAMRRRNSLTERSSRSPEPYDHSNPPTLPRRSNVGPPPFKPGPPSDGTIGHPPLPTQNRLSNASNRSDEGFGGAGMEHSQVPPVEAERPKLRKVQPKPPPQEPSADNELLKKLQRRQNRIQKAEEQGVESLDPHLNPRELRDESPKKEVAEQQPAASATPPVQQKPKAGPPPIPERKTATLSTQPSVSAESSPPPPPVQPPPPSSQPPPSTPPTEQPNKAPPPKAKPKVKAPPPKPKEEEPEIPPWQRELQKRKQKRAEEAEVAAQTMMAEQPSVEKKEVSEEKPAPPPVVSKKPPKPTPVRVAGTPPPAPPTQAPPPPVTQAPPSEPVVAPPTPEPVIPPPLVDKSEEFKLKPETTPTHVASSTTSGDSQLSRSTSLSSIATGSTAPMPAVQVTEPIPIGDWLAQYKLGDYTQLFEASGYDRTDFLVSITSDELTEIGVQKPGHRKKIMSALSSLVHTEHLISTKPAGVPDWLMLLNLIQYEQVLIDAGYDDIDFVTDISSEELQDIGITKKGHLKRFMRGIAELLEISPATPTAADVPVVQNGKDQLDFEEELTRALPHSDLTPPIPPPVSYVQAKENGLKNAISSESIEAPPPKPKPKPSSRSPSHSPQTQRRAPPPGGVAGIPPPPRRAPQTSLSATQQQIDSLNRHSFSSSTSSLSSSYSERAVGSVDAHTAVSESPPRIPAKKSKPTIAPRTMATERVPVRDESDGGELPPPDSEGSPLKKKTYSLEDITAALDELIVQDEFLRDDTAEGDDNILPPPVEYGEVEGVAVGGDSGKSAQQEADEGLDALSKALQGFTPAEGQGNDNEEGEADQLLADIDDMLADLNTHLDFMIPGADDGTDV